jgi:hypothetical protein
LRPHLTSSLLLLAFAALLTSPALSEGREEKKGPSILTVTVKYKDEHAPYARIEIPAASLTTRQGKVPRRIEGLPEGDFLVRAQCERSCQQRGIAASKEWSVVKVVLSGAAPRAVTIDLPGRP